MVRNPSWRVGVSIRMRLVALVMVATAACHVDGEDPSRAGATASAPTAPSGELPSGATAAPDEPDGGVVRAPWRGRPRPARVRGEAAVRENAACVSCHRDEARAWQRSHHRTAFVDAAFQRALAVEPSGFCRGCHAPEADPRVPADQAAHAIGVGCVSCHVDDAGAVLAAPRDGVDDARAPHAIVRAPEMATEQACAGCHEFGFPGDPRRTDDAFMQTTVREHARSPSASRPCAGCHMPAASGRRDHGFDQVRDPAWLREAMTVKVERGSGDALSITLAQTLPGHAFPTGDLFRRIEVGATVRGGGRTSRDVDHLARHFVLEEGTFGRKLELDDRVFSDPVVVELHLDGLEAPAPGSVVRWWVKLQRVATPLRGKETERAIIESEVTLFEGTLPSEVNP